MYKIICNDQIIDVVKKIKFYKHLSGSKFLSMCDESVADYFQGSNNQFYKVQGKYSPELRDYPIAIYKNISKLEYDRLILLFKNTKAKIYEDTSIKAFREEKITELKTACDKAIVDGISIRLQDNKIYQFELTLEDQLNIRMLETMYNTGRDSFLYHAKGKKIQVFDRIDMSLIIKSVNTHILYHTTYFNLAKNCILNMNDIESISTFKYGDVLPDKVANTLLDTIKE